MTYHLAQNVPKWQPPQYFHQILVVWCIMKLNFIFGDVTKLMLLQVYTT